jgi:hypothetical protein
MAERGMLGKVIDGVVNVVYGDTMQRKAAQASAEISAALNSQADSYVPYGAGQQPLEIEGPQMSYQESLKSASQQVGQEQEQDHGIDR